MPDKIVEDIEIDLLLEAVYRHYGYDFRDYSLPSVRRRLSHLVRDEGARTISGLQEKLLHDTAGGTLDRLLHALSINVTSMFRDPDFYLAFREQVVPLLRTYPFIRIWNAGCATGEEAYSIAIILKEEGLYNRCQIYATDVNKVSLQKAEAGVFPLSAMAEYEANYSQAGGKAPLSTFYKSNNSTAVIDPVLKQNIVFTQHNLVTDGAFNEFNVVLCRNVLIYFNKSLQDRVHKLLYDSLAMFGILGLGRKETIGFTSHQRCYEELDGATRLYRKLR